MNKTERTLSDEDLTMWCSHFDHHASNLNHDNVYQIYEHLRETCPVTKSERYGGFWVVSHYADIVTALMDPTTFCSGKGVHIPRQEGQMDVIPIDYDPLFIPSTERFLRKLWLHVGSAHLNPLLDVPS